MAIITGTAKKFDGTAIDYVSIFNWSDGKCVTQLTPDASGKWSHLEPFEQLRGVTYIADGCEPITHGAYALGGFDNAYKLAYYSFDNAAPNVNDSAFTVYGGASIDASVSKFGTGSLKVSSANQYALTEQIPAIGLDNYCIEFFVKTSKKTSSITFFDSRFGGNSSGLSIQSGAGLALGVYANNTYIVPFDSIPFDASNWLHIAVTRHNGLLRVFIGGIKKAEVFDNNNYSSSRVMIGNNVNAIDRHFIGGHIDEFAVSKGDARYIKDFTPPTKSFY